MLRAAAALLLAGSLACGTDVLTPLGDDATSVDPSSRVDGGTAVRRDAGPADAAEPPDASVGRRKLVWLRVPSTGASLAAPGGEHKLQLRLPPPTSTGVSRGVEHEIGGVLSGRSRGGDR